MDMTDLFLSLAFIIVGMLSYFLTRLAADIKELEKNINNCQSNLPLNYVLRDDYHRDITEIKEMISEMYGIIRESNNKK